MRRLIAFLVCAATALLGWHLGRMRSVTALARNLPERSAPTVTDAAPQSARPGESKPILSEKTDTLLSGVTNSSQFAEIAPKILEFAKTLTSEDFASAIAAAATGKSR